MTLFDKKREQSRSLKGPQAYDFYGCTQCTQTKAVCIESCMNTHAHTLQLTATEYDYSIKITSV